MKEFLTDLQSHREARIALQHNGVRFIPGDDTLIVTFQPFIASDEPELRSTEAVWGEDFLVKKGFSVLGVNHQRNNWYRAADLGRLLTAVARQGFFERFERVMFYGGSMGGFAALAFAELSPGCTVLAHNPQSTLRVQDTRWDTRFGAGRVFDWEGDFSDGAIGARAAAKVYVTYDPFELADRRHVERLPPENLVRLPVPMVGHQMPVWLKEMKLLGPIFEGALDGSLDRTRFQAMARARRDLPHYLMSMAARVRRPALKSYFAEKARGIAPQLPGPRDFLAKLHGPKPLAAAPDVSPTIVWALRGSRAAELLDAIAARRPALRVAHDAFSTPPRPHDLAALFNKPSHQAMVRNELRRIVASHHVLVHHVDEGIGRLELALMEQARTLKCRHLLLHRRDHVARIEAAALQSGTAGTVSDDAVQRWVQGAKQGLTALATIEATLSVSEQSCRRLAVESLEPAAGHEGDKAAAIAFFGALGLPADDLPSLPPPTTRGPLDAGQRRSLAGELAWVPTLDEGRAFVKSAITQMQDPPVVLFDPGPSVVAERESQRVSGLAVRPPGATPKHQLMIEQGPVPTEVRWGQASPGGPERFPSHEDATSARFGPSTARADPGSPMRLSLLRADETDPLVLAQLNFDPLTHRRIDGLFLGPWSIGYRPIAGAASDAISVALHRMLHVQLGLPNLPERTLGQRDRYYRARWIDVSGASFRFAVLRDPVTRFLTLLQRQIVDKRVRAPGLPAEPSLEEFIEGFDDCMRVPAIHAYFDSQARTLVEPGRFHRLYRVDQLAELASDLKARTGLELSIEPPRPKPLLKRLGLGKPARTAVAWIEERYADDMALWASLSPAR